MSVLICEGCGELTNTGVCNQVETQDDTPTECYARILEGTRAWVKGCEYDSCTPFMKLQADKLINPSKC